MPSGLKHRPAISAGSRAGGAPEPGRVQGIASNLDDLDLRGEKWKVAIGDALSEGTLIRKIRGATELSMSVHDPGRHLLRQPLMQEKHEVKLDGLTFGFVKAQSEGKDAPMSLTYEPSLVVALRDIMGPHKAARATQTRAEFAQRRVFEVDPRPKFVCPELHVKQPVESAREAAELEARHDEERSKGIGDDHPAKLTVKGNTASPAQRELGERALGIASEDSAPEKVMLSLIEALIVETEMGAADPSNPLQATPASKSGSTEQDIHRYLTGGWGVDPTGGGAIGYFKQNPGASAGEIAQAIQGSAYPDRYDQVGKEAAVWTGAHGGSGVTSVEFKKYEFRQPRDESNWTAINRLAGEVNWRCFESAGVIYFMTDDDLLESRVRFGINDSTPSVVDTTFDLDIGKDADEMTVEAYAKPWAAPPGSVVAVGDHGPADGLWLVERIEAPLARRNSLCKITLKRPTEPKAEPAPKSERHQIGGAGGAGGGAGEASSPTARMIDEIERIDAIAPSYVWGGNHVAGPPPASGHYDCSSFVSRILYVGGLIDHTAASPELMTWGVAGVGNELTIYANSQHVFGEILTPSGWRTFQTSTSNPNSAPGWTPKRTDQGAFDARHWKGL